MPHLEPEELALAALGEPLDDAARAHLVGCEQCASEHAALLDAVTVGRAGRPGSDDLVSPPASVWQAVSDELGLDPAVRPGGRRSASAAPPPAVGAPPPARAAARRRGAGSRWLAVAAAAGVVVGGLGVRWWDQREPSPVVLDQAQLQALPDWPDAAGEAVVKETADGARRLVVTLEGVDDGDGYREVWLIDTSVSKLVSIGVLHGGEGSFALPDGLDLTEYPVVDISEEHFDGDPTHSGDSIVRGVLGT